MKRICKLKFTVLPVFLCIPFFGIAQDDAAELAKKLSNPVASLISVPLQNNLDVGIGEFNGTRNTLNIQPVIPVSLSENLNSSPVLFYR